MKNVDAQLNEADVIFAEAINTARVLGLHPVVVLVSMATNLGILARLCAIEGSLEEVLKNTLDEVTRAARHVEANKDG